MTSRQKARLLFAALRFQPDPLQTNSLRIGGAFVLIAGADLKTIDVNLKLAEGTTVKIGPIDLSVVQVGPAFGDPFRQLFGLSGSKPLDTIQKVEFLDDKSETIESSDRGSGSFGFGENMTSSKSWQIATDVKTFNARVSYFSRTAPVNLPSKLSFGLGLSVRPLTVRRPCLTAQLSCEVIND